MSYPRSVTVAASRKGRGTSLNPDNRFFTTRSTVEDDGWWRSPEPLPLLQTTVSVQSSRSIISRNRSPDVPFEQSINPYQGCEHGCIYCYARPSHAWLDLSPGLDFETRLFAKPEAATLLRAELARPGYQASVINIGANTDPYQPIEREWRITRSLLEVMRDTRHPVTLITKSALVLRDLDLLSELAAQQLVRVMVSVTTLDAGLARVMEPRASAPHRRLKTVASLRAAGVPVGVLMAPVIPFINDAEIEQVLAAVAEAGADMAGHVLLRLPHELRELFTAWLQAHFPLRAERVLNALRASHGGREYDPRFGHRMRGEGVYADLLEQRFRQARRRSGLDGQRDGLRCDLFRPPRADGQLCLFD